jgi:PTH1 family peptidyl-tRNA hydrolase
MKLIVGLGNPGSKYEHTRHNAGFMGLDNFLEKMKAEKIITNDFIKDEFRSETIRATMVLNNKTIDCLLAYPQTFMNDSGQAVQAIMKFYKIEMGDLIVLHDEIDLPLGTVRLTQNSGAAGHNGVKSLIEHLGASEFTRIRIGVESRVENRIPPTDAFVLQNFTSDEMAIFPFEEINNKLKTEIQK